MKSTWRGCLCSRYLRDTTGGSGSPHEPSASLAAPGPPRGGPATPSGARGRGRRGRGAPGAGAGAAASRAGPCRAGRRRASRAVLLRTTPCPGGCPGGRRVPAGFPGCLRPGRLREAVRGWQRIRLTPCARSATPQSPRVKFQQCPTTMQRST